MILMVMVFVVVMEMVLIVLHIMVQLLQVEDRLLHLKTTSIGGCVPVVIGCMNPT